MLFVRDYLAEVINFNGHSLSDTILTHPQLHIFPRWHTFYYVKLCRQGKISCKLQMKFNVKLSKWTYSEIIIEGWYGFSLINHHSFLWGWKDVSNLMTFMLKALWHSFSDTFSLSDTVLKHQNRFTIVV